MSTIEKKEKNLNQLINKLNSLTLTYSQPKYEVEKITKTAGVRGDEAKNEILSYLYYITSSKTGENSLKVHTPQYIYHFIVKTPYTYQISPNNTI